MPRRKQNCPQKMNSSETADETLKAGESRPTTPGKADDIVTPTKATPVGDSEMETIHRRMSDWQENYDANAPSHYFVDGYYQNNDEPMDLSMKSKKQNSDGEVWQKSVREPASKTPSTLQTLEKKFGGKCFDFLSASYRLHSVSSSSLSSYTSPTKFAIPLRPLYAKAAVPKPPAKPPSPVTQALAANKQDMLEQARAKLHTECSNHTKFVCICGKKFESLYDMSLHLKQTGHAPSKENTKLSEYPKLVRGQDMWLTRGSQQTKEILKCICCRESFKSLPDLTVHMMKTKHYASIMNQRSPLPPAMQVSSRCHSGSYPNPEKLDGRPELVSCRVCNSTFGSMEKLAIHMNDTGHYKKTAKNGRQENRQSLATSSYTGYEVEPFACKICCEVFMSRRKLKRHLDMSGHRLGLLSRMYGFNQEDDYARTSREFYEQPAKKRKMNDCFEERQYSGTPEKQLTSCIECEKCFGQFPAVQFASHVRECLTTPKQSALEILNAKFGKTSSIIEQHLYNNNPSELLSSGSGSPCSTSATPEDYSSPSSLDSEVNKSVSPVGVSHNYLMPSDSGDVKTTDIFHAMEHMIAKKIAEKSKDMFTMKEKMFHGSVWHGNGVGAVGAIDGTIANGSARSPSVDRNGVRPRIKIEDTEPDGLYGNWPETAETVERRTPPSDGGNEIADGNSIYWGIDCVSSRSARKRVFSESYLGSDSVICGVHGRPSSAPSEMVCQRNQQEGYEGTRTSVGSSPQGLDGSEGSDDIVHVHGKYLQLDSKAFNDIPVLQSLESLVQSRMYPDENDVARRNYVSRKESSGESKKGNPLDSLKKLISTTSSVIRTPSMVNILGTTNLPNLIIPYKKQVTSSPAEENNHVRLSASPKSPQVLNLSKVFANDRNSKLNNREMETGSNSVKQTLSYEESRCKKCKRIFRTKGGLRYHMTLCMPGHSSLTDTRSSAGVKSVIQKHLQQSQFTRYYKWAEELSSKS